MSITLIRLSDNQVVNYSKGADDMVKNLLEDKGFTETNVIDEVDMYAARGLRTLMFARRELDNSHLMPGVTQQDIEQNYQLLGITGLEDELQDNVFDCIQDFKEAGIHIWMLTGDKRLTAE